MVRRGIVSLKLQEQHASSRRFARHVLSVSVDVVRMVPPTYEVVPGLTMEISEAGFSAMLSQTFEVGDVVEASFRLPNEGRIKVDAVVRGKNLFRYGFEFVSLSAETRQQISNTCESLPEYKGDRY